MIHFIKESANAPKQLWRKLSDTDFIPPLPDWNTLTTKPVEHEPQKVKRKRVYVKAAELKCRICLHYFPRAQIECLSGTYNICKSCNVKRLKKIANRTPEQRRRNEQQNARNRK